MQFIEMNLIAPLLDAVRAVGYETPTPIQESTIPLVLSGKDVLGCAQTVRAKLRRFLCHFTAAQQQHPAGRSPNALRPIRSLILAPPASLPCRPMKISCNMKKAALAYRCHFRRGESGQPDQGIKGGVDILVATPGRLCDLINQGLSN